MGMDPSACMTTLLSTAASAPAGHDAVASSAHPQLLLGWLPVINTPPPLFHAA